MSTDRPTRCPQCSTPTPALHLTARGLCTVCDDQCPTVTHYREVIVTDATGHGSTVREWGTLDAFGVFRPAAIGRACETYLGASSVETWAKVDGVRIAGVTA